MLPPSSPVRAGLAAAITVASLSAAVASPVYPDLNPAVADSGGVDQPILAWGRGWRGGHWGHGWHGGGHWGPGWGGWGSGFALGLGLPLGYYGGYAPYYDGYYPGYYDEPVYRPRVYRSPRYYAPRYYDSYNAYNGYYQCENLYQTGPVRDVCR